MTAEAKLVLVDTSAWIELLRGTDHAVRGILESLMVEDRVCLCAVVMAELIQGATTSNDLHAAEELGENLPMLKAEDKTWFEAGHMAQRLRQKGVTVGLLDCYLASLSIQHDCQLLTLDKHFPLIAKHSTLELVS